MRAVQQHVDYVLSDEELARKLQMEEQSILEAATLFSESSPTGMSEQELRDRELARRYAEMDLRQAADHRLPEMTRPTSALDRAGPSAPSGMNAELPAVTTTHLERRRSRSLDWKEIQHMYPGVVGPPSDLSPSMGGRSRDEYRDRFAADLRPELLDRSRPKSLDVSRERPGPPPLPQDYQPGLNPSSKDQRHSPGSSSQECAMQDHMDYVRRLQEQALAGIRQQKQQQQPQRQSGEDQSIHDRDAKLARYMAETNLSFDKIDAGLLSQVMGDAEEEDTKPSAATTGQQSPPSLQSTMFVVESLSESSPPAKGGFYGNNHNSISSNNNNTSNRNNNNHNVNNTIQSPQRYVSKSRSSDALPSEGYRTTIKFVVPRSPIKQAAASLFTRSAPTTPVKSRLPDSFNNTVQHKDNQLQHPPEMSDTFLYVPTPDNHKKKKKRGFLGFIRNNHRDGDTSNTQSVGTTSPLPAVANSIPPPGGLLDGIPSPDQPTTRKAIGPATASVVRLPSSFATPVRSAVVSRSSAAPPSLSSMPGPPLQVSPVPGTPGISTVKNTNSNSSSALRPPALMTATAAVGAPPTSRSSCCVCHGSNGVFLAALGRKYHPNCFRCVVCHDKIDPYGQFKTGPDRRGVRHPYHRKCYAETLAGIRCAVCRAVIPASPDGAVAFVKHPFFESEKMCLQHAEQPGRRCSGCQRFEPLEDPFLDLNDAGRCVCYACCRTVVVDNNEAKPVWAEVLSFFQDYLNMPVWKPMWDIPVLVVGSEALTDEMSRSGNWHGGSQQLMCAGLCLTEFEERCFRLPRLHYNQSTGSFEANDMASRGFTYYELPQGASQFHAHSNVFAILCLCGLPRDLTASVLAHEALHAWIKLHPQFNMHKEIPAQVEEGCAQLVAMLFLRHGLSSPLSNGNKEADGPGGPSDETLRQYFQFSIERDSSEVYGEGFRKAMKAYNEIGLHMLLNHVILYQEFPET